MRHLKKGRKFGRKKGQRKAFLKSLLNSLILNEKIVTTTARAKTLKSQAEKLVTLAKKQNLSSLRILLSKLPKKSAQKLYYEIAPRFLERRGGYLTITHLAKKRKGDGAQMSRVEFVA
ncbi:MAG: 50S ribosomal protein L17 [Patescibacteria group bacterium]|nr:50S ribosomal protein L17 [Patescibacteria group bacterium]